jgi:hypothetical protein
MSWVGNVKWTQRIALQLIRDFKESRGCEQCGARYPFFVLELHHLGAKSINLGTEGKRLDEVSLRVELAKCKVLCCNCHAFVTHDLQTRPRKKK